MQTDWASENLQIIRTLMERSAIYRRAMAPVLVAVGVTGIAAGALAVYLRLPTTGAFVIYWIAVAAVCLAEAFLMIRRQALKDSEPFWSPPTRRVAQAVSPAFFTGLIAGLPYCFCVTYQPVDWDFLLIPSWMVLYGLAMHAAGFFMPRGFKLFGWGFVLGGSILFLCDVYPMVFTSGVYWAHHYLPWYLSPANCLMGGFFGGGHLAYGLYLHFTEKRGNVA